MILLGDCLERLKELPDNSVDSVCTDPPYGWRFMGKAWDGADIEKVAKNKERGGVMADGRTRKPRDLPAESAGTYDLSLTANQSFQKFTEMYCRELMRVLKPGGHMLIFCGPRTYHRMASGVEDAGFEIRDQLQWLFGSGFPKSHDISKGIDKAAGAEREVVGSNGTRPIQTSGRINAEASQDGKFEREENLITAPSTDLAKQWQGWGSALKPANEPIVLARKPLSESTLAKNVLRWGVGGLNIDASRVGTETIAQHQRDLSQAHGNNWAAGTKQPVLGKTNYTQGRWPANLILDEQAAFMLDEETPYLGMRNGIPGGASRFFYVAKASKRERNAGLEGMPVKVRNITEGHGRGAINTSKGGDGIRENKPCANVHPTVKPLKLMEYLIKLVTPPNGTVLDPFMGSGSTGVAAFRLGYKFIGCEMNEEYCEIAKKRIEHAKEDSAS